MRVLRCFSLWRSGFRLARSKALVLPDVCPNPALNSETIPCREALGNNLPSAGDAFFEAVGGGAGGALADS
eukprot:10219013-Alexandrium_andersonii.AAC.1